MCPPSSIPAGNKLSIVTTIPTHPAKAMGCKSSIPPGGGFGIMFKASSACSMIIQSRGAPITPAGTCGEGTVIVKPTALIMNATINPEIGPSAPISNRASLFGGSDFCIITAPKVPKGGGPGIK